METIVDPASLAALRRSIRFAEFGRYWPDDWDRGGCSVVSEELESVYGWPRDGGCYLLAAPTRTLHIAHYWNLLPDGRLIDVTADQWDEGDDVRITDSDDPRYDRLCECGGVDG